VPLGITAAAAALAAGYANVNKIISVKSGLPNEGGGGGSSLPSASAPTNTAIPEVRRVDAGVNAGIISREAIQNSQPTINLQPTLVIDDVTASQSQNNAVKKTATL
jgi:hypothetical protein